MRSGDVVRHRPSGEKWVVAYVEGDWLAWCGWPPGEAKVSDCDLLEACSDEEHKESLRQWAGLSHRMEGGDRRAAVCCRQLFALEQGFVGVGI